MNDNKKDKQTFEPESDETAPEASVAEPSEAEKFEPEPPKKKSGWPRLLFHTLLVLLLPVVLAAGYAAYDAWNFLNSAPESPGRELSIVIEPGTGLERVTSDLYKMGVIKSSWRFKLLAQYRKKAGLLKAGEFVVNTGWKPEMVLENLVNGKPVLHRLTLREGLTWWETAKVIEEAGFARADDFSAVIRDRRFLDEHSIPFASAEGFLFPDTYLLRKPRKLGRAEAEAVAGLLLDTFWSKAGPVLPAKAEPAGPGEPGKKEGGKAPDGKALPAPGSPDSPDSPDSNGERGEASDSSNSTDSMGKADAGEQAAIQTQDSESDSSLIMTFGLDSIPKQNFQQADKESAPTQSLALPAEAVLAKEQEQIPALIRLAQASQAKREQAAQSADNATADSSEPGAEGAGKIDQSNSTESSALVTASPSLLFVTPGSGKGYVNDFSKNSTKDFAAPATPATLDGMVGVDSESLNAEPRSEPASRDSLSAALNFQDEPGSSGALPGSLSPYELRRLIILASLVEKETAVPEERARVSGVYSNRMKKNMLLQCDPTIIYGIGPSFSGSITRSQLNDVKNLYNTYKHAGLPPGPICSPGLSAIKAAVSPDKHDYLYFVATGNPDGSHTFSTNLKDHNRAVNVYQKSRR